MAKKSDYKTFSLQKQSNQTTALQQYSEQIMAANQKNFLQLLPQKCFRWAKNTRFLHFLSKLWIRKHLFHHVWVIPLKDYEAAQVDGCNAWRSFQHITIPGLKPVLLSVGLLDTIWTFRLFPLVWLLTGGGPGRSTEVLATFTYRFAFVNFQFSKASTVAVILLVFTMIFTWFYLKYRQRAD
ncbi:MAG: sugar ABC transporter permease [bacterium]|nr:sugar ABC transporter permease [bacterium]